MEQEKIIGGKTFTFYKLPAFTAVTHLTRLKDILSAGLTNGVDTNVAALLAGLDEKALNNTIMPLLKDSAITCTSLEKKLQAPKDVDAIYDVDELDEFFELIGHIIILNYGPLLKKTLARFGVDLAALDWEKAKSLVKEKAANLQK